MSNPKYKARGTPGPADPAESHLPLSTSSNHPRHADKREVIDAIQNFFTQNSSDRPQSRQCGECGSSMQYLDAYFWLDGVEVASKIPLPFCPVCQPDVLTSLRRKRGVSTDIDKAS
jgi:hypothetical protein